MFKFVEQVFIRVEGRTGSEGEVIEMGTAAIAQSRVESYFNQLRETLLVQEAAALNAVDTYVRERLCSLRQLQEDLVAWLSQVIVFLTLFVSLISLLSQSICLESVRQ